MRIFATRVDIKKKQKLSQNFDSLCTHETTIQKFHKAIQLEHNANIILSEWP